MAAVAALVVLPAIGQTELVWVPAGDYEPLFQSTTPMPVTGYFLDAVPVTNGKFLEFVKENPRWQRSRVPRIFADEGYLGHWQGDLDLGSEAERLSQAPVVRVSWFAARAYAAWQGKRLPTWAEWERAAKPDSGSEQTKEILEWYSRPTPTTLPAVGTTSRNALGISDLHGLVWEWVEDFNSGLVTGESRGDASIDRNLFCGSGAVGAARPEDYATFMRYTLRTSLEGSYTLANVGFRCARDAIEEEQP